MSGGAGTAWLNGLCQKIMLAGVLQDAAKQSNVWNFVSGVSAAWNETQKRWDLTFSGGGSSGDVVGPGASVDNRLALFSGTTGKLLKVATLLVSDLLLKSGAVAMTGDLDLGSHKATNAADGSVNTDLATVGQMTTAIAAAASTVADWKQSVRAATTTALPANTRVSNVLTANANGALTAQDGVTLIVGDRLLVKDEATGANRGIYTVTAVGSGGAPWSLTRAVDADTNAEVTCGLTCLVEEGTVAGGKPYILTTANPITVNTTALTFTQLSSATAGNGLTGAGALAVLPNGTTIDVSASGVKVADASIGPTQLNAVIAPLATAGAALALARMNAAGTAAEFFTPPGPVVATNLTNANATKTIADGSQFTLPASTLSASTKTLTLGTTGTPEVDEVIEVIVYSQSQNYVVANGGPLADTLYTVVAGTKRILHAKWNGTDWRPAGKIRLT